MATALLGAAFKLVYVTVPSQQVATQLSRAIIEGRLAACVNILPGVKSVYEWEGKLEESNELLLIMKTEESRLADLESTVKKLHPYEFVVTDVVAGSEDYLKWVFSQTRPRDKDSSAL